MHKSTLIYFSQSTSYSDYPSVYRMWVWPHDDPRAPPFNDTDYEVARYAFMKVITIDRLFGP